MNESVNLCEMQLASWLKEAFSAAFGEAVADFEPRVQPAQDAKFGDFQCNDVMRLSKTLHRAPRDIAETALAAIPLAEMVEKAEVAGPGFINLTVKPEWLAGQVSVLAESANFGIPQTGAGKKVVIDYSSPNAAKQMHIGHIRSTVIGNAIDRIHRALGYEVIADNHLGDWGTQFGILIKGYRECLDDAQRAALTVADLEEAYVQSSTRAKTDEQWQDSCRKELVKLQQGDGENVALWKKFIEISINEFTRMYDQLGVSFDTWRGESHYNDMMPGVIERLQRAALAEESDGALIVRFEEEKLPIAIVRKSDGGFNYTTSDLACVESRVAEYNPERIIYVTDERQQLHFKQFFTISRKLGVTAQLVHVWFGLMSFQGKAISTREGNLIKLDDLISEAKRRSLEIVRSRNVAISDEEAETLASQIGIGAIKYADLSHDPTTPIDFNWDKALALDGNSGPYLQYACARINSLLDKAAQAGALPGALLLSEAVEKRLVLTLMRFPATVLRAADTFKPSILADYLYGLAQDYSSFYQRSPVLKADPEVRASRLRLCELVAQALKTGLNLLGIETPKRI